MVQEHFIHFLMYFNPYSSLILFILTYKVVTWFILGSLSSLIFFNPLTIVLFIFIFWPIVLFILTMSVHFIVKSLYLFCC